jgi:hypothetical protein
MRRHATSTPPFKGRLWEWCWDWFGEYPSAPQTDPIGPQQGYVKVVRGGALDLEERNVPRIDFYTPHSRLAVGPGFGVYEPPAQDETVQSEATGQSQPGEHAIGFRIVQAAPPPTEPSRGPRQVRGTRRYSRR